MRTYSNKKSLLTRIWWIPLATGLLCLGFGIWCLCSPVASMEILAYLFAAGFILAGVFNLTFAGINASIYSGWGWSLSLGLLELIGGIWLFLVPEPVLLSTFVIVTGVMILVGAINSIAESCTLARYSGWWMVWAIIMLLATIFCAVIFLTNPIAGGVIVWLWLGISLICFGISRISLAFMLKSINKATYGMF